MDARTITGALPTYPRSAVRFRQLATFLTADETYLSAEYSARTNDAGDFSIAVPTPDTGTVAYMIELPNGASAGINLAAGAATTLEILLASAFAVGTAQDVVQTAIDAHALIEAAARAAADTTLQTNITSEASARASADTTLQTNITSEASTRAAADSAHAALGTTAHGGIPILAAANTFALHNAFGASAAPDSYAPFSSGLTFSIPLIAAEEMADSGTKQRAALGAYLKFNPAGAAAGNTFAINAEVETTAGNIQTHGTNLIGVFGSALHKNAKAITNIRGLQFFAANQAGATVSAVQGIFLEAQNTVSGVVTNLTGLDVNIYNQSSAVTTNAYGVKIAAPVNSGGAAITNNYGIHIGNITGGVTLNYAILTTGGQVRHMTGAAAALGLVVMGAASQSANLQEWHSSASAIYGTISENGYFTTRKIAVIADAELAASELAFWFDSTNGAGKLMIKAKTVNGTVVTGEVPLV